MNLGKTARYTVATVLVATMLVLAVTVPASAGPDRGVGPTKDFVTEEDLGWDGDTRLGDGYNGLHGVDGNKKQNSNGGKENTRQSESNLPQRDFLTEEDLEWNGHRKIEDGYDGLHFPEKGEKDNSNGKHFHDEQDDNRNVDLPPVESENADEPDAADSVDDRLEEFKDPDSGDFDDPSRHLDIPDGATRDFDTIPGPSLGDNLDKNIGPVPEEEFRQRFDNRPGDDAESRRSAANDENLPQKDFKTENDELEWDTEIGPNPAEDYEDGTLSSGGADVRDGGEEPEEASDEQNSGGNSQGDDTDGENLPQKDFKTESDETDWDAEIGPNPADGYDQRFDNRPSDDVEENSDQQDGDCQGDAQKNHDSQNGDLPPAEAENADKPDAADSVDDRLEEFKNPDSGDFEDSPSDLDVPEDAARDFDTTPGPSLGKDLDRKIGPNPSDAYRQRFRNRPGDGVGERDAGSDQNDANSESLPRKDFKTGNEEPDLDSEVGPNPAEGFRQRFENRPTRSR